MKSNGFIKRLAFAALLSLGAVSGAFAQFGDKQVLVGGTDFDPSVPAVGKAYVGTNEIKMIGVFGGIIEFFGNQPSKATDLDYDYSTQTANKGERIKSHFHNGEFMAITGNPIQLDSLHYIDDKKEDWGVVWSRVNKGIGGQNKTILSYRVNGLKPNSSVKVIIKYRSVIDPDADAYDKLKCNNGDVQITSIKVAENPDQYNLTAGMDAAQVKHGESGTYDNSKVMGLQAPAGKADAEGSYFFNVNIMDMYMGKDCASIEITAIEVYGTIDPQIFSEDGETICAGEIANVKVKGVYEGAKYQWYDGSTPIAGATAPNYSFETPSGDKTYDLQLKVTYDGVEFTSNKLTIKTEKCCEIINEDGVSVPASRKIVFKDDFGEIDLSDKTGKTYKVWDYSDISNPVQLTKKTSTPFRYELDDAPLGCTFREKGAMEDGEYAVAGVLTGFGGQYKGMDGAKLEWAADLHGIKLDGNNIHFDHSGTPEGCCLLINCKDQTGGQNIYERDITHLCQNRQLFFECYITIFTSSGGSGGKYNPVDVTVRLTEIGNPANVIEEKATQTIPAEGGTGNWVKISGQIFLEKNDAIKLEIVNNQNTDKSGNDLVLDDIIIRACAAPSLQAYFDINTFATDTITCDNSDDAIHVFAKPSEMLTNYFGGAKNTRYLYQWSLTPTDKKSWKRIKDPISDLDLKAGSDPFVGLVSGDKVYFRVIAGSDYTLSNTKDEDYNADDPCASYTISDAIECVIDCPACTEPASKIKIEADKKATDKKNKKDVIELCYGESVTLSQAADITPDKADWASSDFGAAGYAIKWFESEKPGSISDAKSILNDVIDPKVVEYDDPALGGTEMPVLLYAVDALYPEGTCKTADTIYIRFNEVPDAEFRNPKAEFCEGEGKGLVDMTLTKGTASDYLIHWWQGADDVSGIPLGDDKDEEFFEGLASEDGGIFSYQLVDKKTGCVGEVKNYEVIVNAIPDAPKDEKVQYTINGNSNEVLTTEKFAQTLDASYKLVWFNSDTEPNSKGSKSVVIDRSKATDNDPFVFYIAYQDGDCYSKRAKVVVEVLAAPIPTVKDIDLCKDGTYDAKDGIVHQDAGYELVWFKNAAGDGESSSAPTDVVDASTPGVYTFYVAQRATTAPFALSDIVWFNVTVYDVKAPKDASRHEYCANETAEELKAEFVKDEKNYYYADEIVFVSGTSEASTFIPNTKMSSSQKYEYQAYQKFTTPESQKECKGPSIDITVDVVAVEKPKVNHSVSYVKSEAKDTKEFVDILVKSPDAIDDVPDQTLLWAKKETDVYVKGSTSSSKPSYDPDNTEYIEKQERYVKWEATTATGLVCQSDPERVDIIISSTPAPIVNKIEICEEVFKDGTIPSDKEPEANAKVNDNNGKLQDASSYELVWFEDKDDADAAMTDASALAKGSKSSPSLQAVFTGVNMSDETVSEWSKSLYVVQSYDDGTNVTTSPASEMKITVNATPKLQPVAHDPVCDGPVNLTDNMYWNVSNGVTVSAQYSFGGSSVTQNASSLTEAGEYTIVATSSLGCESKPLTLQLDIRKLKISMDPKSETCPGDDVTPIVTIDFSYNKKGAEAEAGKVNLTWKSEEKTSDKMTQSGKVPSPDDTEYNYTSGNFEGKAGDTHTITLTMTDGYCTSTAKQTVEIGNGPAGGTYSWTEAGNESTENGKSIPLTDGNKDKIEIYACGDAVTVDFSKVTMDANSDVEWFKSQDYSSSPYKTSATPTFSKNDYGKYFVRYTNNCYAYATVEIKDASISITPDDVNKLGDAVMCENEEYKIGLEVKCNAGKPTREWYKDGDLYANNNDGLTFAPAKKKDQGDYRVEYRYDGCKAELDVVNLKVKEYVKVDVEDYEMYEGKKSYIIIAGDNATAPFKFTVPSDPSDAAALTATKTEKTSRNEGSVSSGNASFDVTAVDEDHIVNVKFENDDYCMGEVDFQVLRDAKLVLKANVDTAMCLNEEKPFTIDTIGTGTFRRPGAKLEIIATPENGTGTQEKGFNVVFDTLKKNISPRVTTTYDVTFTYRDQKLDTSITVVVYNFKVEPINEVICSGEQVELKATVSPAGSKIEWFDEDKSTSLGGDPILVSPVFDGPVSAAKSQHKYWARPYSDLVTCTSSGMTPLFVDVYRPLEGDVEDKTICEGDNVRVDAGSYGATTYTWIIDGDSIKGSRYYQDTPSETTVYKVYMTRGTNEVCKAEDQATVTVTTKPVISSIDSVGYRDVDIVMDPMFGTPAFRYSIDGGDWTEDTHLSGLKYTVHTIKVEDANGCVLLDTFVVKDPALEFPIHFSPNDDGENEYWTVPVIKDTYPDAEFTIYDRWGKKLFEFKGADDGWDGTYNGVRMPSTDYWYECIIREIDKVYKGHFTLIRR